MLLRRLILVLVLLLAQLGASVHALEHFSGKVDEHLPGQVCSQCLASHDLNSVLNGTVPALAPPTTQHVQTDVRFASRIPLAPSSPRQRGPPSF